MDHWLLIRTVLERQLADTLPPDQLDELTETLEEALRVGAP